LFHVRAAATRTLDFLVIVLVQGKYGFEGFVAIIADIVVHGHGNLPLESK
jgi:hypothetical protein